MKKNTCLLIGILVLLVMVSVPAVAGYVSGPAYGVPDPGISAPSPVPAAAAAQKTLVQNAYLVLTTSTPQPGGILYLGSAPSGASVYIDGSPKGTTPLTLSPIAPGIHTVTLKKAGYADYSTKVSITAGLVSKMAANLVPVTPGTVTRTLPPPVSATTGVLVTGIPVTLPTTTTVPTTTMLTATTVPVTILRTTQQATKQPGTCERHYFGTGTMVMAPDGRLNCTTLISTEDQVATLTLPEGTVATDAAKKPVIEIRITPVNPSEIPPGAGPDGKRWTGRAYHFLPDHATFDPPVIVSFTLSQGEWDRSDPSNLTIKETDAAGPGWESLPTSIDPVKRTISAPARHFSIIGLFSANPVGAPPAAQQSPVDLIRTATGSSNGPLPLSPVIPDKFAPLAAVAAGVAISIAGAMAGGSMAVSQLWDKIIGLFQKFLCAETTGLLSSTEIEKRSIRPAENLSAVLLGLSSREILVIGISALGFAVAFILQDRLELQLTTLLIYVCAGGVATILHDLAHKYAAYRTGCVTEFQFWSLGTVTMLSTAWLFGNAFAKPSRTLIRSGKALTPEEAAVIRLAGPLTSIGLAVLSLFLIPLGGLFVIAGSAGFTMNLLNGVFSLVPVRPNDGVEVYAWNRVIWACVFIPLIVFYLYIYTVL
jgi:Zn-dependent protease